MASQLVPHSAVPGRFLLHARVDFGPSGGGAVLVPLLVLLYADDAAALNAERRSVIADVASILARHRQAVFAHLAGATPPGGGVESGQAAPPPSGATPVFHGALVSVRFELDWRESAGGYAVLNVGADGPGGAPSFLSSRLAQWSIVARVRHKARDVARKRATIAAATTAAAANTAGVRPPS